MLCRFGPGITLCVWALATASVDATTTIDLMNLPGNQFNVPWGYGGTSLYAQSIVANDFQLDSVTMRAGADYFDMFFALVVTGTRPDTGGLGLAPNFADTRYTSAIGGIPALQTVQITFTPALAVTPGETLFLVFDTFSYPQSSSSRGGFWATEYNADVDPYPSGEFVYLNTGQLEASTLQELDAYGWFHRAANNQDLALRVTFTPEPAALVLMMFAAPLVRRRARADKQR